MTPRVSPQALRTHLPKVRRASWNLADQALSALTNTVMAILVARNVDAQAFGSFALAMLIFSLTVGVVRAVVVMPLTIRHSAATGEARVLAMRAALGAALALALPVSAGLLATGIWLGGSLGQTLCALGLVMPVLLIQDTCRFAFFAWMRPQLATLNDLIWAIGQFSLSGLLIALEWATPWSLVLAWGAGAATAALVGCLQLRSAPDITQARPWLVEHKDLTRYLLGEYLVDQGAFQGGVLVIGSAMGVGNLGSLRAAQTLVGPLGIISSAGTTFGIPEVSRRTSLPRRTMSLATAMSLALFTAGLVYTAVLLLIPDWLGTELFGDTWAGADSVLLPVAAASVIAALKLGPVIFVYGLGLAKRSFPLVATLAASSLVFMIIGALTNGVVGLAWGMALAQVCVVPLWFLLLRSVVNARLAKDAAGGPGAAGGPEAVAPPG